MSILELLFNGKIFPAEACVPNSEIFKTAVSNMKKAEEKFEEGITKEQKELFIDYKDSYDVIMSIELEEFFKYGFVLGIKLQQEVENVKL